ncbi:MAG TPA: methyltransferase domain-containing protein [Ignavibacteriaceae bacterium]|nr:methyltransferase domain-containing protein [Ignavibacteriaceae bacterium]
MDSLEHINSMTRQAYNLAAQKYHDLFHNEMNEKEYDRKLLNSFAAKFNKDSLICDAGCGPSAHIGRYLFEKGIKVVGVDISEKCVELAQLNNSNMNFECADICSMPFDKNSFDGLISYYSIINTPKIYVNKIFAEFHRVLKPDGYLLIAVKAGINEGYVDELLEIKTKIYSSLFGQEEIADYFKKAEFALEFIDKRNPYDFEISNERIFAIGEKVLK